MYTHIVLFRLKDEADVPRTVEVLRAMEGRIPSLKGLEVGVDDQPSPRSAHIALVTRFDDPEGLAAYQVHPVHQEVLAHMGQVVSEAVKVDYPG